MWDWGGGGVPRRRVEMLLVEERKTREEWEGEAGEWEGGAGGVGREEREEGEGEG